MTNRCYVLDKKDFKYIVRKKFWRYLFEKCINIHAYKKREFVNRIIKFILKININKNVHRVTKKEYSLIEYSLFLKLNLIKII